mgnify:CR=1 FL=1
MKLKKILLVITAMSVMLCGCSKAEPSSSDNNNGNNDVTVSEETTETNAEGEYVSYGDGISDEDIVLDVFENIRLSYEGFSPDISVSVDTSKMRGFLQDNVTYTVKPDSELKNGDKVIVTAMYNNSVMKSHDYVVKKDVLEMTIDGKEVPAEDIKVIDEEYIKNNIYLEAVVNEFKNNDIIITIYNPGMIYDTSTWEFMIDYELEYNGERVGHSICVPEGESVKIKIMQYHSDYAQKNNYTLVDKDIEFEVTVWNPNEKGEYMWYDENGNEVYGNEKPEIKK